MPRRTKIVATVGPATDDEGVIGELIDAGVNVFRLNFSHGSIEQHLSVAQSIRRQADARNSYVGILADLQGPKIRIGAFPGDHVRLEVGDSFALDTHLEDSEGSKRAVALEYKALCEQTTRDDILLLDDGRIRLKVTAVEAGVVETEVLIGGVLGSRKGINKLGGGLAAPALTDKDIRDIAGLAALQPDFVAVSFVSSADDVFDARNRLEAQGVNAAIIAKIERAEVVADEITLKGIISASHGVMVARGDLGVEVGDPALIGIQKDLISRARRMDRVVITATQMMESMINSPMPTRAEVFDVANAVLDGTDAVMLSGETATGNYPIEVVKAMSDTCLGAEQHPNTRRSRYRIDQEFTTAQLTTAMAAMYAANHHSAVRGIACLTETGSTPLLMSRLSSGRPIFALSSNQLTLQRLSLCRGVIPLYFDQAAFNDEDVDIRVVEVIKSGGYLNQGDEIILTKASAAGSPDATNLLKILPVN
ncbi:MAG: pyruvate kinase [Pseudomonadota bacterium]